MTLITVEQKRRKSMNQPSNLSIHSRASSLHCTSLSNFVKRQH